MLDINGLEVRYAKIHGGEGCQPDVLLSIEKLLGVKLPSDFVAIAKFYSGGLLGGISHHDVGIDGDATNIVRETFRLRQAVDLTPEFIVLAEPSESLIVLHICGEPAVIWCDSVDAMNISLMAYENPPNYWFSYASFFSHLLDQEELERGVAE